MSDIRLPILRRRAVLAAAGGVLAAPALAQGDAWPSRPVRLVVPWAPGGASDALGRLVAGKLAERIGQQVVVENRAGAGGTVGMAAVSRAAPDGYTIIQATSTTTGLTPVLMRPEPFDAGRDFAAVAFVALDTNGLFSSAALPPADVDAFVAWVRAQPNAVPYASSGVGTLGHLGMELFARARELRMTHVPYRGAGPAMADVVSGTASAIFTGAVGGRSLVEAQRLRLLALTGRARHPDFPAVPTVHELGLGSMDVPVWHGYLAPPGTPQPILARLHAALVAILGDADFLAALNRQMMAPWSRDQSLADAQAFVVESVADVRRRIAATGITAIE
jgi:tripartite-type tricarboxylate transporter receptor subunit TctC